MGARFLLRLLAFTLLGLVLAAGLNILVDPTSYLTNAHFVSHTLCVPGIRGDERQSKAIAVQAFAPDAVLIGTSQVGLGFDPRDPILREKFGRVYNLGIAGLRYSEMDVLLSRSVRASHLNLVIIGTSFGSMMVPDAGPPSALTEGSPVAFASLWNLKNAVFSLTALFESAYALLSSRRCARPDERLDGMKLYPRINQPVQLREKRAEASVAGRKVNGTTFLRNYRRNFSELGKAARLLCAQGIAVDLVILPNHARRMEIWSDMVGDARMDQWKRDMTKLADRLGRSGCAIGAWDFGYHNVVTTADFDGPDAASPSFPYWENSHFKMAVGHRVLQRIFLGSGGDFGVKLTLQTVEAHIARAARARAAWRRSHPAVVAAMAKLVRAPPR